MQSRLKAIFNNQQIPAWLQVFLAIIGIIIALIALRPSPAATPTHTPTALPASDTPLPSPTNTSAPTDTLFPTETALPPATPTEFIDRNATAIAIQQATIDSLDFQIQGSATAGQRNSTNAPSEITSTVVSSAPSSSAVTSTPGYPCDGEIVFNSNALLNVVHVRPVTTSSFAEPVQQGIAIRILAKERETATRYWYQIADRDSILGWIPVEYVSRSDVCPK